MDRNKRLERLKRAKEELEKMAAKERDARGEGEERSGRKVWVLPHLPSDGPLEKRSSHPP